MLGKFCCYALCAALAVTLACSRRSDSAKAERLAALDSAYKSGLFTKEEYDAKKAAIEAQPPAASAPATSGLTPAPAPESGPIAAALPQPSPQTTPTSAVSGAEEEPAPAKDCDDAEYKAHMRGPQTRFYPVPIDRAKKAALDSLALLDFTVHKNDNDEIEASKRRHIGVVIGAGGEREILHFMPAQQDGIQGTLVTGETQKSATGILGQKSWTAAILAEIACALR